MWEEGKLQYALQKQLMGGLSALTGQLDSYDTTKVKKLIFRDQSFVFISHDLYKTMLRVTEPTQRAMIKRLSKLSRFAGSPSGCAALRSEREGHFEALAKLDEDEATAGCGGKTCLTWEMQHGSRWVPMIEQVQNRLNRSIASGEPHPIVLQIEGEAFEFDAYSGFMHTISDNQGLEAGGLDSMQALFGFVSAIGKPARHAIRSVADPEPRAATTDIMGLLGQLGFNTGDSVLQQAFQIAGTLSNPEDAAAGSAVDPDDLEELKRVAEPMGFTGKQCQKALEATAGGRDTMPLFTSATEAALEWLFEGGGATSESGNREDLDHAGLQTAAAVSIESNLRESEPSALVHTLSEASTVSIVEDQVVADVYEGNDGLISTVSTQQIEELMSNRPLWVRQLALHQSWAHRFDRQSTATNKLERANSIEAQASSSNAVASLKRAHSCPPEPGSLSANPAATRMQALHALFGQESRNTGAWCPFKVARTPG